MVAYSWIKPGWTEPGLQTLWLYFYGVAFWFSTAPLVRLGSYGSIDTIQ